jgi:hypothetical protein
MEVCARLSRGWQSATSRGKPDLSGESGPINALKRP